MKQSIQTTILFFIAVAAPAVLPAQTSVGGVAYAQYVYQLEDTANHVNGFDVTRAYVNLLGKFSGGVSTRITADIYRQAGDNSLRYRLKYAFVGYAPAHSPFTFKIGQIQTPWIDFEEALWDYRMQGTVALDRNGYMSSSDFGAGVDGKWGNDRINASTALLNGEGYSGGTGDQRKDFGTRVSVRVRATDDSSRTGGLRVTGYAQIGKPTSGGIRQRFAGLVSYRSSRFTLAAELAATTDSVTATPVAETHGRVISVFGVYHLAGTKASAIARYDVVDPNTTAANDRLSRVIVGLSYQLSPNLRILADVDQLSYQGTPSAAQNAVRSQAAFRAQFAF